MISKNLLWPRSDFLGDSHEITAEELPEDFMEQAGDNIKEGNVCRKRNDALLADVEVQLISTALDRTDGNIAATARIMGISRNKLYRKLRGQTVDP